MYITLTEAEQKELKAIWDRYTPEIELLSAEAKAVHDDKETWLSQSAKIQMARDYQQLAVSDFLDEVQRSRFAEIEKGGKDAIIESAKEQIPLLIEDVYKLTEDQYRGTPTDTLKQLGVGMIKDNKLLLNANYTTQALKDELKLHIDAIKDDKDTLRGLMEAIIEAVEVSNLTDNTEITEDQKPLNVKRFRRNPLGDIASYGLMNDKINAQLLQDGDIFTQKANGQLTLRWAVNQAPKKQEAVPVYMALTYEGNGNAYKVNKRLTGYDKQVLEAVATRYYYWQLENPSKPLYITPQEIWRTMNGKASKDGRAKPSAAQVQKICDSLDKMRFTRFYMDISAEIEAFNLSIDDERITGGRIETYVLNSSKVEFTTDKGNTVQGYRIGEEPILYTYNKAKNHLLYVPYEMLDTSDYTSDSENVAEFKGYLLQQIQLMKNAAEGGKRFKRSNIILLETIYKDAGIQPPEERTEGKQYQNDTIRQREVRRFRQADRQKIEGILDAWKAKAWIKGYVALNQNNQPLKEKQQAKGYRIDL